MAIPIVGGNFNREKVHVKGREQTAMIIPRERSRQKKKGWPSRDASEISARIYRRRGEGKQGIEET